MSDELENVVSTADVPPAPPVDDTPPAPPADEVPTPPGEGQTLDEAEQAAIADGSQLPADDTPPAQPVDGAGGAAEPAADEPAPDANESRTDFVEGLRG